MITKKVIFKSNVGMHLRPAAEITKLAGKFSSEVFLSLDQDNRISAKSIIGILAMTIQPDAEITIEAEGFDEADAVDALVDLIGNQMLDL